MRPGRCFLIDIVILGHTLFLLNISIGFRTRKIFAHSIRLLVDCLKLLGQLILIFGCLCMLPWGLVNQKEVLRVGLAGMRYVTATLSCLHPPDREWLWRHQLLKALEIRRVWIRMNVEIWRHYHFRFLHVSIFELKLSTSVESIDASQVAW